MKNIVDITKSYQEKGPEWKEQHYHEYRFDYMEESVKEWKIEHITRDMIGALPFGILITFQKDYYGEDITDFDVWHKQREEYIDYLYAKYKR